MDGLLSKKEFLHRVRSMDPYLFEQFVADVWEERGFNTTVRSASGDRGIDIIATAGEEKQLIQAKRYSKSNTVGSQTVRNYATLYQQVKDATAVVIVTTSSFTNEARKLADDLDVEAIDGDAFFEIVSSHAPSVAVEYLHQQRPQTEDKNVKNNTDLVTESPFSNQYDYAEIKRSNKSCLDCASSDVWQAKLRKGIVFTLIKCADCQAVWTNDDSWPEETLDSWDRLSHEDDLEKKEREDELDPCFIATAAYGTHKAEEIDVLRNFRDSVLNQYVLGRFTIKLYYMTSPPVADWIRKAPYRRYAVRKYFVAPLVKLVEKFTSI